MTPQSSLKLEKWYFDVVGPDGDLFVGYHIQLSPPGLNIAAGLWRLAGRLSNFMPRITRQNPPIAEAGFMQARCRGGSESWRSITPQVAVTLLDTEQVRVEWECLACGARAEFSDPDHGQVVGFGYAEKLVITGKPWLVPIHTLYWGRMVAEHFSLVWIKWVGPVPIERAWLNGQCCDDVMISNHQKIGRAHV